MPKQSSVIIVGAGAAGISAACRLIEEGYENVIVLEAKDRIGGRLHTVEFADNIVDLGGQWVHGENIVYNLAAPHNFLESSWKLNDFEKHSFVDSKGQMIPSKEAIQAWKLFYEISENGAECLKDAEGSYGEYFTKEFYKHHKNNSFTNDSRAEEFLEWMHQFDNSLQCSDNWFDVSARGLTEYKTCEGDLLLNWKDRGYKTLFELLMRKLPNPQNALPVMDKILFGKEVSGIDWSSNSEVIVKTTDGVQYTAQHVIFTASLGVLKEKHLQIFNPPLSPKKQLSIQGLGIGVVAKIFLEFPYRWWSEDCAGFGMLWSKQDRLEFLASNGKEKRWIPDLFQFFTVDYQPRVLCGWLVGQSARDMEELPENIVKNNVYELLEKFLGKTYNIPRPDHIIRSKWYSDPHFRGCYSYRSMAAEKMNIRASDLAMPVLDSSKKPVILFAGEATHSCYYSTVHGAIETGYREADRILRYYRQVTKSSDKPDESYESSQSDTLTREKTKLVIIGAGIAGLAAAKTLEEACFKDYILLEAQDEIGGRINSEKWNSGYIEVGAQFLHGDQSLLGQFAKKHDLLSDTESTEGAGIFLRDDGLSIDQRLVNEIDDLVCDTLEDCEKYAYSDVESDSLENIGKILRHQMDEHLRSKDEPSTVTQIREEIFDWIVKFLVIDNSCFTLQDLSTKYWGKFRYVGGPEHLIFKNGYRSLTDLIVKRLDHQNIRLNSPVETIQWQQDGKPILLTLSDKCILADCVIITSSLGYLKENYRSTFIPELPANHRLAIESLGFGLINKIFLDFGEPWWDAGTKGIQMLWCQKNKADISCGTDDKLSSWIRDLTGFDVLENQKAVLLGWVGGRGAYIVEKLSEDEIASNCLEALKTFLRRDIPAVTKCKRTRWNANKFVRGAYSHIPTCCDALKISPATLAEPIFRWSEDKQKHVPVLMFAGEATHEHFYSTTHGAYDTGRTQAMNFLRYHVTE